MRRKLLLSLLAILLAFTCLALSEGLATCEHEYDQTSYQHDDEFHWFVCSKCSEPVEKTAHDSKTLISSQEPVCGTNGYNQYRCETCQHEWREPIAATSEHTYTYDHDDFMHWQRCTTCARTSAKGEHNFVAGEHQAATCTEPAMINPSAKPAASFSKHTLHPNPPRMSTRPYSRTMPTFIGQSAPSANLA